MKRLWSTLAALAVTGLITGAGYLGYTSSRPQTPAAATAPLTISVTTCDVQQTVTAPGSVVNTRTVKLEMPYPGQVAEVLAGAGDSVSRGQVLARLAGRETYEATVSAAELELAQAQQALADLHAEAPLKAAQAQLAYVEAQQDLAKAQRALATLLSPKVAYYQQALDDALIALEQAQAESTITDIGPGLAGEVNSAKHAVEGAYEYLGGIQSADAGCNGCLADRVAAAQEAYDAAVNTLIAAQLEMQIAQQGDAQAIREAQEAVAQAQDNLAATQTGPNAAQVALAEAQVAVKQAQLAQAQGEWESRQNGPEPLALNEAQAQVEQAATALAEAQYALEQLEIKAPFAGVVLEANAHAGETMPAAAGLFTLTDPQALEVIANVTEEDYPLLSLGQSVEVFFDARPDVTVQGNVGRIIPKRIEGDSPRYHLYITLNEIPEGLADGMTSDTAITIAKRQGVLCLPRASVRASSGDTTIVKVWDGIKTADREITIGLRGDTYIEIVSGLAEGEQVVMR